MKTKLTFLFASLMVLAISPIAAQWSAAPSGTLQDLNTAWRIDANTMNVGGNVATMLRSTDGGVSFSAVGVAVGGNDIAEMQFMDASLGYAVADNGRFLTTNNAGASWSVSTVGTGSNLTGLHFRDAMNGHVVGRDGVIFQTTNGGVSWTAQSSGTAVRLEAVHFHDALTGYIAGRNDTWLSTTNGGTTWTNSNLLGTGRDLNDLFFLDANTGFIGSDNGVILRTLDGGATWNSVLATGGQDFNEVYFNNPTTGWAVGDGGVIRTSTDGGNSWLAEVSGTVSILNDVHISSDGSGIIAGDNGTILVMGAANPCGSPVAGLNSLIGFTDVTLSWNDVPTATAFQIQGGAVGAPAIKRVVSSNIFTVGAGFFTAGTTYSWRVRAQCADGTISPYSTLAMFAVPSPRLAENSIALYPNPATDFVVVNLGDNATSWTLVDMMGQVIDAGLQSGQLQINIGDYSSGMYHLVTEDGKSSTFQKH